MNDFTGGVHAEVAQGELRQGGQAGGGVEAVPALPAPQHRPALSPCPPTPHPHPRPRLSACLQSWRSCRRCRASSCRTTSWAAPCHAPWWPRASWQRSTSQARPGAAGWVPAGVRRRCLAALAPRYATPHVPMPPPSLPPCLPTCSQPSGRNHPRLPGGGGRHAGAPACLRLPRPLPAVSVVAGRRLRAATPPAAADAATASVHPLTSRAHPPARPPTLTKPTGALPL